MSNRRVILWLLLAVVILAAANLLIHFRVGPATLVRRDFLLGKTALASLTVTPADGKGFRFVRDPSWRLVEPYAAQANVPAVLRFVDTLTFAPVQDILSAAEMLSLGRSRADFGLEPPHLTIEAADASGRRKTVFLGGLTKTGESAYAAVEGETPVYVVPSNDLFSCSVLSVDHFRSRSLLNETDPDVTAFDIRRERSFLRFVRKADSWELAEPKAAAAANARVDAFLEKLRTARVSDFVWPSATNQTETVPSVARLSSYGLDPGSAVSVSLKGADGTDRHVSFGNDAGKGYAYALVQDGAAIARVDSALRESALQDAAYFTDTRLFPFEPRGIVRLSVFDEGTHYALSRGKDGAWCLDAPVVAPADAAAVDALVARLLSLRSPDLDANGPKVSVAAESEPVAVSRNALLGDLRPENLRAKEMVCVDPKLVRRLVVTPRGGKPTAVAYDVERRVWNVETSASAGTVDERAVESVLKTLAPLKATDVVSLRTGVHDLAKYGLDEPLWTVAVDQDVRESVRKNILLGEGGHATVGSSDAVFRLAEDTVRILTSSLLKE